MAVRPFTRTNRPHGLGGPIGTNSIFPIRRTDQVDVWCGSKDTGSQRADNALAERAVKDFEVCKPIATELRELDRHIPSVEPLNAPPQDSCVFGGTTARCRHTNYDKARRSYLR